MVCVSALTGALSVAQRVDGQGLSRGDTFARVEAFKKLGEQIFFDPSLSASGGVACASCHSPAHAFGPPNAQPVQLAGKDGRQAGLRAAPSLTYIQAVPAFTEHFHDSEDEADASIDNGPTGGLTWDGRVDRGRDQARLPLFSPLEMANEDEAALARRIRKASYGDRLREVIGAQRFADDARLVSAVAEALEIFEQDERFYPYNSRYDAYLAGKAALSPQEVRGLALFNDPAKGNCSSCHRSERAANGTPPQFTDFGLIAIGVPRNPDLPANADPKFFDLGMCGPLRTDLAGQADYCGRFRTPSLRNVAKRQTFFHNGVVHDLRAAVAFYAERDTSPETWYPRAANGVVRKFDDLPPAYHGNINTEPPFGPRPGNTPALTASEIDDVVAFLKTLTDEPTVR